MRRRSGGSSPGKPQQGAGSVRHCRFNGRIPALDQPRDDGNGRGVLRTHCSRQSLRRGTFKWQESSSLARSPHVALLATFTFATRPSLLDVCRLIPAGAGCATCRRCPRRRVDGQRMVSGTVQSTEPACNDKDAPRGHGLHKTPHNRFVHWSHVGRLKRPLPFRKESGNARTVHDRRDLF